MSVPHRKPRVGTLFLSSGWFHDVGMKGDSLVKAIENTREAIVSALSPDLELIFSESVFSAAKAREAAAAFRQADIDLLLVCYLTWTEDQPFVELLERVAPVPTLLWCYHPADRLADRVPVEEMLRSSGGVGVLQSSGLLSRLGRQASLVVGHHKRKGVVSEIVQAATCAALRQDLRQLKIGVLPSRCDQMATTWVDDLALRRQLGPALTYLSVEQLATTAEGLDEKAVAQQIARIRADWPVSDQVDDAALGRSLRASLALYRLAAEHGLGAIALQDVADELHQRLGVRPGLMLPGLFRQLDLAVSMEADVGAALLMVILIRLTGQPCLYTEPLTYDLTRNHLVMGHAGLADARLAGPDNLQIIPDFEYKNSNPTCGAVTHFSMGPGPVTLANCVYTGERFQIVALEAESLADGWVLEEGYAHALVCPAIGVESFFRRSFEIGVSQHWIVLPAYAVPALRQLASYLPFDFHHLST